jgi:hypothetical protein
MELCSPNGIVEELTELLKDFTTSKGIRLTKELDTGLKGLRESLINLTHVVKKPIDGSAANIERGKLIESLCEELK